MPLCSVIIVSYHTGPVLFAALKSVLRQQQLGEVVLVDNGNPPDILARLQQMSLTEPRLKIRTGHGNAGFAKGCNLGAELATGDFFLFLHADCLLPPRALVETMAAFDEVAGAVLAGCWLRNPDGSEQKGGRQPLLTPTLFLQKFFPIKRSSDLAVQPPQQTCEVPAICAAFMCIRASDFIRLQGFDEAFFLRVEDLDLCMRVRRSGGKIIFVPRVKVTHMHRSGSQVISRDVEWHKAKGLIRYFGKFKNDADFAGGVVLAKLAVLVRFSLKTLMGNMRKRFKGNPVLLQSPAVKRLMILTSGLAELPETHELANATVLLTGATSQVGLCVLRRLLAAGASVWALSRGEPIPFEHERLRWLKGDMSDKGFRLDGVSADILVHCAPLWHLPAAIEAISEAGIRRVIAFGTTSVFAKATSKNWYEKELVDQLKEAEAAIARDCHARGIYWTLLRPTVTYGVGLDVNITSLAKFITRFGFFPVYPPARGRRHPVHADDLAMAVMQVVDAPVTYGKSYNLSGGVILSYREMLEQLSLVCRKKVRIIETTLLPFVLDVAGRLLHKKHINGEIAYRMNDDLIFFYDAAKTDFAFAPRSFLSGGIHDIEGY